MQLGYGDLEYPTSNTPHISKLAREGLVLSQFYTTSPVSSPARASLLTGRYHMRTGVYPGGFAPNDVGGTHPLHRQLCIISYAFCA